MMSLDSQLGNRLCYLRRGDIPHTAIPKRETWSTRDRRTNRAMPLWHAATAMPEQNISHAQSALNLQLSKPRGWSWIVLLLRRLIDDLGVDVWRFYQGIQLVITGDQVEGPKSRRGVSGASVHLHLQMLMVSSLGTRLATMQLGGMA